MLQKLEQAPKCGGNEEEKKYLVKITHKKAYNVIFFLII
jgi:hypothetical protein